MVRPHPYDHSVTRAAHHTAERQKELGAFYTPPALADALASWAIRSASDRALDGSCGGLVFLGAAHRRLIELGATPGEATSALFGVDVDGEAIDRARAVEATRGAKLVHGDFFALRADRQLPAVEAVIGNPPYIRYQGFNADGTAAHRSAAEAGVPLTQLASSWAPFLIHLTTFVSEGGRLAQVLPAELLHAQYASEVLTHLCKRFSAVAVVAFEERVFPGALEEVVLLLAEGAGCGEAPFPSFRQVSNLSALNLGELCPLPEPSAPVRGPGKLLAQLLPERTQRLYRRLAERPETAEMSRLARVNLGAVTGANPFFLLSAREEPQLPRSLRKPAVSKASHVRGSRFTREDHRALRASGIKSDLFVTSSRNRPSTIAAARSYLERGEREGIDQRYKCRVRDPWYSVPLPKGGPPDLFLIYCSHDFPRVAVNEVRALHTNSVHGVWIESDLEPSVLATAFYNSLTMLSTELTGRSYGGGVLKLEPTEAKALLIPPLHLRHQIVAIEKDVDAAVRAGDLGAALALVDPIVLERGLGLSKRNVSSLRSAGQRLRARRHRRSQP